MPLNYVGIWKEKYMGVNKIKKQKMQATLFCSTASVALIS
jgi:hypothetical protein